MGANAVTLPNTKNETSGRVHHALQLREQSVREAKEGTGIIDTREDKRLNEALGGMRIEKTPNFANTPQVKERGPTNVANVGGYHKVRIKCDAKVFYFGRRL